MLWQNIRVMYFWIYEEKKYFILKNIYLSSKKVKNKNLFIKIYYVIETYFYHVNKHTKTTRWEKAHGVWLALSKWNWSIGGKLMSENRRCNWRFSHAAWSALSLLIKWSPLPIPSKVPFCLSHFASSFTISQLLPFCAIFI